MEFALAVLVGYLFGCSNMAYYVSKIKKIDLTKIGSKNLGTSNTFTEIGAKEGLLVFFHDAFKAVIAILIMQAIFPNVEFIGYATGYACILGHIFPFYNKFKGGKGFATYIGVVYALNPVFALIFTPVVIAIIFLTDYIISGTFVLGAIYPTFLFIIGDWESALVAIGIITIIFIKHIPNFIRIKQGTEKSLRDALTKKKPTESEPTVLEECATASDTKTEE